MSTTELTKSQFVHRLFSSIAKHYDLMNTLLSFNRDNYWRNCLLQQLSPKPGDQILDVCCGTGKMTVKLAEQIGGTGKITGLDYCQPMLTIAAENIKQTPAGSSIDLLYGNAMQLPFPDNTFDAAVTAFGLRNLPNIEKPLGEMYRVVRPGGKVISLELAKPTAPILRQIYYYYFEHLLPFLGNLNTGRNHFYSWLPQSLKDYPDQSSVTELFTQAGLKQVYCCELTGGIAAIHGGVK